MAIVAVTGASGFIGRRLVTALRAAGYEVRVLLRREVPGLPRDVQRVMGDLADAAALAQLIRGVDAVVHGGGAVKALSATHFQSVNAAGTTLLAELAAAQATPPQFVHLSSLAARAPHLSAYAASKAAGETAVLRLAGQMPIAVLRPPAVYGPGDREALKVLQMAAHGFVIAPRIADARLSLVHVDDAAAAVLAMLRTTQTTPQPVEFDDGKPGGYAWPEVAAAAAAALGRPVRLVSLAPSWLHAAGAVATLTATLTRRPAVLSTDKIGEILHPDWVAAPPPPAGYHPRWGLAEGFENTIEWAASQGLLRMLRRS